jgi:hypothetical protein
MKQHIDMLVALVVSFLLYTRPAVLVAFSETFVGRAVLLLTMIGALLHSTIAGILVAILIVVFGQKVYGVEGFTPDQRRSENAHNGGDHDDVDDAEKPSAVDSFRAKHCKMNGDKRTLVDDKGKPVSMDQIAKQFPHLAFDGEACDPCSDACLFKITSTTDRLKTDEAMRGKDSKQMVPEKK